MAVGRTSDCFAVARGAVMRVTLLDACGLPFDGQCVSAISDGWSEIAFTGNIQDSETTTVTNARGRVLATSSTDPKFLNVTAAITMVQVEPIVFSMLTGAPMKIDPLTNKVVGFGIGTDVSLTSSGFALELWAESPGTAGCDEESEAEGHYVYQVMPFMKGGVLTSWSLNAEFVTFSIEGATSQDGNNWGVGPYNDVYLSGAGGTLGALPDGFVTANEHVVMIETAVAPPEATCDCLSSGTAPTTATAGNPGTFNGEWIPETRLDLTSAYLNITATPGTAWTTNQHVVLGDGTFANWSGTAWVAGKHA